MTMMFGTAPDLLVWSAGALPKMRRWVHAVRNFAVLFGQISFGPLIVSGFVLLLLLLMLGPTRLV